MNSMAERYRRWWEYEKDVQRSTLRSLEEIHPERREEERFLAAVRLFAHMLLARQMWLSRLGGGEAPAGVHAESATLEALREQLEAAERAWDAWLGRIDDATLAHVYEYRTTDGKLYRSSVEDTLTQLLTHGAYHRGQIASHVRAVGGTPAPTDFIFWARGGR